MFAEIKSVLKSKKKKKKKQSHFDILHFHWQCVGVLIVPC